MDGFLEPQRAKKGTNKVFIVGLVIGAAILALGLWILSFRPSVEDQKAQILAGSYHEGSPEFAQLTKDIIISTDDKTVESPTGFGRISMYINGRIRNKGTQTLTALEVNVAVVDRFNKVLKEKRVLAVPSVQAESLGPNEVIPITLALEGFDKDDDRANIRWKVTAIRAAQP